MKKLIFLLVLSLNLNSCYQSFEPGTGVITVKDSNGYRVDGAYIRLSQPGQTGFGIINVEGYTNLSGEFSYTHDPSDLDEMYQTHNVILNIYAEKSGAVGSGIIAVNIGETTYETVTIF